MHLKLQLLIYLSMHKICNKKLPYLVVHEEQIRAIHTTGAVLTLEHVS